RTACPGCGSSTATASGESSPTTWASERRSRPSRCSSSRATWRDRRRRSSSRPPACSPTGSARRSASRRGSASRCGTDRTAGSGGGQGGARGEGGEDLAGADRALTSYALARRDRDELMETRWRYVLLDEAQNIKNAGSATAQACKALPADHRLALTGTPLEN